MSRVRWSLDPDDKFEDDPEKENLTFYRGKLLEKMTKKELIEAVKTLYNAIPGDKKFTGTLTKTIPDVFK